MNRAVIGVFLVIMALVMAFLFWQLTFADGGILRTGYNALANVINTQYALSRGEGSELLPEWTLSGGDTSVASIPWGTGITDTSGSIGIEGY